MIDQEPAGMGIRENTSLVTDNVSRFIPHYIASK
jgi:glutathionylspermidine synthase